MLPKPKVDMEKRDLDNLWQHAFPFEIELESMDKIYQFNWDFTNLEKTLQEGGELYGKMVYLFVSTEPHIFDVNGELKMVPVPVVVAVDCPFPPSDQIGISIVHTGQEEIVPMKALKMIWEPYVPRDDWNFGRIGSLKTKVFVLCCAPRRSAPKRMKSERPKEPLYCKYMPYYPNPHPHEDDATVVRVVYPLLDRRIICDFHLGLDDCKALANKIVKNERLPKAEGEKIEEFLKVKVKQGEIELKQVEEVRKKIIDDMDPRQREAFGNIKFYKFYPVKTPETPDVIRKTKYINKYYPKADYLM